MTIRCDAQHWSGVRLTTVLALSCLFVLTRHLPVQPAEPEQPETAGVQPRSEMLKKRDTLSTETDRLKSAGRLTEALSASQQMLDIERKVFGEEHLEIAGSLTLMAEIHTAIGDWDAARREATRALEMTTRLEGPDHWAAQDARLALADVAVWSKLDPQQLKQLVESMVEPDLNTSARPLDRMRLLEMAEQTLATRRRILGDDHRLVAEALNSVGKLLFRQQAFELAGQRFSDSLAMTRRHYGTQHPRTAYLCSNLADALARSKQYAESVSLFREAMKIHQSVSGVTSRPYQVAAGNLAKTLSLAAEQYLEQANAADARDCRRESLSIRTELYGEADWRTATPRAELLHAERLALLDSSVLQQLMAARRVEQDAARRFAAQRYLESLSRAQSVLALRERVLGVEDLATVSSLARVAESLSALQRFEEARVVQERLLPLVQCLWGENHSETAHLLDALAETANAQGRPADCAAYLEKALAIRMRLFGERSAECHTDLEYFVDTLDSFTETNLDRSTLEAVRNHRRTILEVSTKCHGSDDWRTTDARLSLADAELWLTFDEMQQSELFEAKNAESAALQELKEENYEQGLASINAAVEIRQQIFGQEHRTVADDEMLMAGMLMGQQQLAQAQAHFQHAFQLKRRLLGDRHPAIVEAATLLATCCESRGEWIDAVAARRQAMNSRQNISGKDSAEYRASVDDLVVTLGTLANAALANGQVDPARQSRQEILELVSSLYGVDDWRTIDARLALADLDTRLRLDGDQRQVLADIEQLEHDIQRLIANKDLAQVIVLAQQQLAALRKLFGDQHRRVAEGFNRLANLFHAQDTFEEAHGLYERALELHRQVLGEDHPATATVCGNLGENFKLQQKFESAEPLYRRALEIQRRTLGSEHAQFSDSRKTIEGFFETWFEELNKQELRVPHTSRVIAAQKQRIEFTRIGYGDTSRELVLQLLSIAPLHAFCGDFDSARKAHEENVAIQIALHGHGHPAVVEAEFDMQNIARMAALTPDQRVAWENAEQFRDTAQQLKRENKYPEAITRCEQSLKIHTEIAAGPPEERSFDLRLLGELCEATDKPAEAAAYYRQSLDVLGNALESHHPRCGPLWRRLAKSVWQLGNYEESANLYRQAIESLRKMDREHSILQRALAEVFDEFASMLAAWLESLDPNAPLTDLIAARRVLFENTHEALGPEHWRTADARVGFDEAEQLATLDADDRHRLLESRQQLVQARQLRDGRKFEEAQRLLQQALQTARDVLGPSRHVAVMLNEVSRVYGERQEHELQVATLREASVILSSQLGEKHPEVATLQLNLAQALVGKSGDEFARADEMMNRAIDVIREVLGEGVTQHVNALRLRAQLFAEIGDYDEVVSICQEARRHYLQAHLPETGKSDFQRYTFDREVKLGLHPDYLEMALELANAYTELGKFPNALELLVEALDAEQRGTGGTGQRFLRIQSQLASLYLSAGDYGRSEPLLRAAINKERNAFLLNNLARLYFETGEYAKAEPLFREALELFEKSKDKRTYAVCLDNLALVLAGLGDHDQAKQLYQKALDDKRSCFGEASLPFAISLNNLGETHLATGAYEQAKPLFEQALDIYRKLTGEQYPEYLLTLGNLARVNWAIGNQTQAVADLQTLVHSTIDSLELSALGQSERQQIATLRKFRYRLDNYLSAAMSCQHSPEEMYRCALSWKGCVLLRQRRLRSFRHSDRLEGQADIVDIVRDEQGREILMVQFEKPKLDELERVSSELARLAFTAAQDGTAQALWREKVQALTAQKEYLERELAGIDSNYRTEFESQRVGPAELQAAIPPAAALVDFVQYWRSAPPTEKSAKWQGERCLLAFVVRQGASIACVDLGPSRAISDAVDAWRLTFGAVDHTMDDQPSEVLRRIVWDKVASHLGDAEVVLIAPDGALTRFPFAALPGQQRTYLIEERGVAVVPVPQLLPALLAEPAHGEEATLLVVGGVDFEADPGTPTSVAESRSAPVESLRKWQSLPGAVAEVDAIHGIIRSQLAEADVIELRNFQATEEQLRKALAGRRYLHFATHGFFAPTKLVESLAAASGPDPKSSDIFARQGVTEFHPGLLSGLVLAGANQPPQPDKDDGILTALEVAELDMTGVELATLSACETGLGEMAGSEGLLGLQRAFQAAGARTTVASMWQIHDEATQLLMTQFYRNLWGKKLGKLAALRQAQLHMLEHGKELQARLIRRGLEIKELPGGALNDRLPPYYWAGFVLAGDWR